jgi:hypothetical protein
MGARPPVEVINSRLNNTILIVAGYAIKPFKARFVLYMQANYIHSTTFRANSTGYEAKAGFHRLKPFPAMPDSINRTCGTDSGLGISSNKRMMIGEVSMWSITL